MKKKFVLFVAVVLIAVATCVSLVACTSSTPSDFMEKWLNAEKKTVVVNTVEQVGEDDYGNPIYCPLIKTYLFDGSLMKITTTKVETDSEGKETKTTKTEIIEISGEYANYYVCYPTDDGKGEWEASCGKLPGGYSYTMSRVFMEVIEFDEVITSLDNEDFKKDFVKKDGWYVAKFPYMGYGYTALKFEKNALLIKDDIDKTCEFTSKYAIGCDTISIPAEAKTALQEYKNSLSE